MAERENRTGLPIGLLAVVALATGGYYLVSSPLESSRHKEQTKNTHQSAALEAVPARSWQDPIQAVRADWNGIVEFVRDNDEKVPPSYERPNTVVEFGREFVARITDRSRSRLLENRSPETLIIGMLSPGGPFAEDAEVRRRQRHALMTALTQQAGIPDYADRIGYFVATRFEPDPADPTRPCSDCASHPVLVGYEEFSQTRKESAGRILILWLSETDFGDFTLARFSELIHHLLGDRNEWPTTAAGFPEPHVTLIGPSNSGTLSRMIGEARRAPSASRFYQGAEGHEAIATLMHTGKIDETQLPASDVAGSDEQPADVRLMKQGSLAGQMVSLADAYLDTTLAPGQWNVLYDCFDAVLDGSRGPLVKPGNTLARDEIKACMDRGEFERIQDADMDWRQSVTDIVYEFYEAASRYLSPAGAMLQEVNAYLDTALDVDQMRALDSCFSETLQAGDPRQCLHIEELAAVEDSDPIWRHTVEQDVSRVADLYRSAHAYSSARAQDVDDATSRLYAAILLAEDYLDTGFEVRADGANISDLKSCVVDNDIAEITASGRPNSCKQLEDNLPDSVTRWTVAVSSSYRMLFADTPATGPAPAAENDPVDAGVTGPTPIEASRARWQQSMRLVSARATIPIWLLNLSAGRDSGANDAASLASLLRVRSFESAVAKDDAVLLTVLNELKQRGIDPCENGNGAIAVLVELDSEYGRLLVELLEILSNRLWSVDRGGASAACNAQILPYAYLRGVDGELAPPNAYVDPSGESAGKDGGGGESAGWRGQISLVHAESPVGAAQLDYVRRLADEIAQFAEMRETVADRRPAAVVDLQSVADLKKRTRSSQRARRHDFRVSAIGVLGSDVYDKQLILHALRERLPGTVLFTTDLDSRLVSAESHQWTHNLIVGSSYGMSLNFDVLFERTQNAETRDSGTRIIRPPPFRDTYQTAMYVAARHALDLDATPLLSDPAPRLFEIGRGGPVDITTVMALPRDDKNRTASLYHMVSPDNAIHDTTGWWSDSGGLMQHKLRSMLLLVPLALLAFSNWSYVGGRHAHLGDCTVPAHNVSALIAAASLAVMFMLLLTWRDPSSEPWLLIQGISALPTMTLQLTALVFSVCLTIIAWGSICEADNRIVRRYFDDEPVTPASDADSRRAVLEGIMPKALTMSLAASAVTNDAREIWSRYRVVGTGRARLLRSLGLALAASIPIGMLIWGRDEYLVRGLVQAPDFIRYFSALFSLALLFFCTDALKLAMILLNEIRPRQVRGFTRKLDGGASKEFASGWSGSDAFDEIGDDAQELTCKFEFLLEYTKWITPLMVYPALVLAILLFSRSSIFDGWTWSPAIIAVYALTMVYLLVRAYLYQKAAVRARDDIVFHLRVAKADALAKGAIGESAARVIQIAIDEINAPRSGAFVPWTRHPILQSIALPSGGLGALALIETFV